MWIIAAIVLVLCMTWFLLSPLLEPVLASSDSEPLSGSRIALIDAKERGLRALKDLELDFAMGKVSREDFESSKQTLSVEVAALLKELKGHEGR